MGPFGRAAAFTLVELLVTIVIIAVIAALMIAGIPRIRESARATGDMNQLRQAAIHTLLFAKDHNDKIFTQGTSWCRQLMPEYLHEDSTGLQSPFDGRKKDLTPRAVSYGLNYNVVGLPLNRSDTHEKLYLFGPALQQDGSFSGTMDQEVYIHHAIVPNLGTFAKGKRITVAFLDGHTEHIDVANYAAVADVKNWFMCSGTSCLFKPPPPER